MKEYQDIERDYCAVVGLEHRKKYAQFFTPPFIADKMGEWVVRSHTVDILEPAFGLGVFTQSLWRKNASLRVIGYDIDPLIIAKARSYFKGQDFVEILQQDYITSEWERTYDGIICNPPYFKFHAYDNRRDLSEIKTRLRCKLSGMTNLYALFLLKSLSQLREKGRCAYIVPSEFLNADYGVDVKRMLLESGTLRHVVTFKFSESLFEDVLTTVSIVLCAKDRCDRVGFTQIDSVRDMERLDKIIDDYNCGRTTVGTQYISSEKLDPAIKWKSYYQEQNGLQYRNLTLFSNYAKVVRGIATGANEYFIFNKSKAVSYNIETEYLLPCICKSCDVKIPIFTSEDFDILMKRDKNVFLFNAKDSVNHAIETYICKGEKEKINLRYLTSKRSPWYSLEKRVPAPIWVSVFNRSGMKFVRNEAGISNLTTFHGIYVKDVVDVDLFFAYLITPTARKILSDNSREYGGGLIKFEPNDLNRGKVVDFDVLDKAEKKRILDLYVRYKKQVRTGEAEREINAIDKLFREKYAL